MKIDVDTLFREAVGESVPQASNEWYPVAAIVTFARLIINECALEAEECKMEMLKDIYNDACSDCAAAIRAMKP